MLRTEQVGRRNFQLYNTLRLKSSGENVEISRGGDFNQRVIDKALIGFQGAEFSIRPIRRMVVLNPLPYLGSCKSRAHRKRAISPNSLKRDKSKTLLYVVC